LGSDYGSHIDGANDESERLLPCWKSRQSIWQREQVQIVNNAKAQKMVIYEHRGEEDERVESRRLKRLVIIWLIIFSGILLVMAYYRF
jgi:hypothetical protein